MKIEKIRLQNFRCFGNNITELDFDEVLTVLVGGNGSGKTSVLQALSRLFGTSPAQRAIQRRDFHIPVDQQELPTGAQLFIEAILAFPELSAGENLSFNAVPAFFNEMSVSDMGQPPKARIRLQATWTDDGTPEGAIEEEIRWILSLNDNFSWEECPRVHAATRSSIQFIYLPANRDATTQVTSLLKGRIWQAARWSTQFRAESTEKANEIQTAFSREAPADFLLKHISHRWQQVHEADTDRAPCLRLVENSLEELVRNAEFTFKPDEAGREHRLSELSDGQRSLFHIALTAATLETEQNVFTFPADDCCFEQDKLRRVYLTILAIEEPENSLSPFFLARIIKLAREIGTFPSAQVLLSSHSPAILGRIEPEEVRYLRLDRRTRCSSIRELTLPQEDGEASRYVRLAVKAYPELYFARFVILGEGDSERFIIPRLAEKMGVPLDPSFVPVVPLGGRFVDHFWRLLNDLGIPHATLLDLDLGRQHGGPKIIQDCFQNLEKIHNPFWEDASSQYHDITPDNARALTNEDFLSRPPLNKWLKAFQENGIFFSHPIDLDFAMLRAFPTAYHILKPNERGPQGGVSIQNKKQTTLKTEGDMDLYDETYDVVFQWYPYLFLNRSKPETHLAAFSRIPEDTIVRDAPAELTALINYVGRELKLIEEEA